MNIVFIGPYKENRLSEEIILSLKTTNANIYPINYIITPNLKTINPIIKDLENHSIPSKIDVLVQCVPPFLMEYHKCCGLNVGIIDLPTINLPRDWANRLNLVDKILSTNDLVGEKIPFGTNLNNYKINYSKIKELEEIGKDRFLIYSIGEYTRKSGFSDLIRLYFSTFNYNEKVCLILKVDSRVKSGEDLLNSVLQDVHKIKESMGLIHVPPVHVIANHYNDNIHVSCDLYVDCNHGLDFNFNIIDSMGYGKTPIGLSDLIPSYQKFEYSIDRIFGCTDEQTPEIFTSRQNWKNLNVNASINLLRKAVFNEEFRNVLKKNNDFYLSRFNNVSVGNNLLKVLQDEKERIDNTRMDEK